MDKRLKLEIENFARELRITELQMFANLGFGHIGGALSSTDLLAVLYHAVLKYQPENPKWKERDRLVVSKGHAGPAVYAALALKGFFSVSQLDTLNTGGTKLPSHCDRNKTPGIDMTTGSLGQGASAAAGIADVLKGSGQQVYLLLGDGECQEGQVWEMAMYASQRKLNNLTAFIDRNKKQLDGYVDHIMSLGDLEERFKAFGWNTITIDGHDVEAIYEATMKKRKDPDKPYAVILDTIKGKGAQFVEQELYNHHLTVSQDQANQAIADLLKEEKHV